MTKCKTRSCKTGVNRAHWYCRSCCIRYNKTNDYTEFNRERREATLARRAKLLKVRLPTNDGYENAQTQALNRFNHLLAKAMGKNPHQGLMISIAIVSEGGNKKLVSEMNQASLCPSGGDKANLVMIEEVQGRKCWQNPTRQEMRDIAPKGVLVYDGGNYSPFLAEDVERFLQEHVLASPNLQLLQRVAGQGGTRTDGPWKVGVRFILKNAACNLPFGFILRDTCPQNLPPKSVLDAQAAEDDAANQNQLKSPPEEKIAAAQAFCSSFAKAMSDGFKQRWSLSTSIGKMTTMELAALLEHSRMIGHHTATGMLGAATQTEVAEGTKSGKDKSVNESGEVVLLESEDESDDDDAFDDDDDASDDGDDDASDDDYLSFAEDDKNLPPRQGCWSPKRARKQTDRYGVWKTDYQEDDEEESESEVKSEEEPDEAD